MAAHEDLVDGDSIDAAMVAAYRADDADAFRVLWERHLTLLKGLARKVTVPGYTREDVEQEAAIGFMDALRRFDPDLGVPFGAFLTTCVRARLANLVRDQNRSKRRAPSEPQGLDEAQQSDPVGFVAPDWDAATVIEIDLRAALPLDADAGETIEQVLRNVGRIGIDEAIARYYRPRRQGALSANETKAAVLILDGVGLSGVADVLGWPTKQADNTIQRAKRKLRLVLNRGDEPDNQPSSP